MRTIERLLADFVAQSDDEKMFELVDEVTYEWDLDPLVKWRYIRALIEVAPTPHVASYIAAGPLEMLIDEHGDLVADLIREAALESPQVARSLGEVWLPELSPHVKEALGRWIPKFVRRQ